MQDRWRTEEWNGDDNDDGGDFGNGRVGRKFSSLLFLLRLFGFAVFASSFRFCSAEYLMGRIARGRGVLDITATAV